MAEKVAGAENRLRHHLANPFLVLEVDTDAGPDIIERQGYKLLAMLSAGVVGAKSYSTPLGPMERTEEMVRTAMAELRDPDKRLVHEWWVRRSGE